MSPKELDELDYKILSELMKDARKSVREIAKAVNSSPATVHSRLQKLIKKGVIRGFIPLVDSSKVGYPVTAIIMVSAKGEMLRKLEEELRSIKNVIAIYDITGDYDLMIIAKFRDMEGLDVFVKDLLAREEVVKTLTHIAFNVVKEDLRLPL
ncbi:AsnC family transcriptional regulator [Ignicoccus islandicus DSM 13165]|uniref:AsnC family transcriptional regulator n=1 Tax=Ignicoccus islandicus DSM 13165 TaxID=940295 RepID=A0A0U3F6Z3_9CREN|nr:Lrp/AsnC family transcriptional regulator [Ignicoccus islandicus]ALU11832.1 AsnC family transcriptional regulator [Ignicoccus islandicus DSM 13165]